MIPKFEFPDYFIVLYSIVAILWIFTPCIPAFLISVIKKRSFKVNLRFLLKSCAITFGSTGMITAGIITPFHIINTFLTPIWNKAGYTEFVVFFTGFENIFMNLILMPLFILVSFVVPFKLMKGTDSLQKKELYPTA